MTGPTPSAIQRADGIWLPTLDGDVMPSMFVTKDAALSDARKRLHSWWHRTDAMDLTEYPMSTCKECNE